METESFK